MSGVTIGAFQANAIRITTGVEDRLVGVPDAVAEKVAAQIVRYVLSPSKDRLSSARARRAEADEQNETVMRQKHENLSIAKRPVQALRYVHPFFFFIIAPTIAPKIAPIIAQPLNPRESPANAISMCLPCVPLIAPVIAPAVPVITAARSLPEGCIMEGKKAAIIPSTAPTAAPANAPSSLSCRVITWVAVWEGRVSVCCVHLGVSTFGGGSGIEATGGTGDACLGLSSKSSISAAMFAKRSRRFLSLSSKVRVSSAASRSRKLVLNVRPETY